MAAPTGSAQADVIYLHKRLVKLGQTPVAVILNRSDETLAPWVEVLRKASGGWPALGVALEQVDLEAKSRKRAGDRLAAGITKYIGSATQVRTPTIEASDPAVIVKGLATALTKHLKTLAGR